jgi:hypothetical protein
MATHGNRPCAAGDPARGHRAAAKTTTRSPVTSPTLDSPADRPEDGLAWVKSSKSYAFGNCVEVANYPGGDVAVRNSRFPDGPVLRFTPAEWHAFMGGTHLGEFDRFAGPTGQ